MHYNVNYVIIPLEQLSCILLLILHFTVLPNSLLFLSIKRIINLKPNLIQAVPMNKT